MIYYRNLEEFQGLRSVTKSNATSFDLSVAIPVFLCWWHQLRAAAIEGRYGSRAAVVGRLMVRPVCPQLRKCRVRPGSFAWCHKQQSHASSHPS